MESIKDLYFKTYGDNPYEENQNEIPELFTTETRKTIRYYMDKVGGRNQMIEAIHDVIECFDFEKVHRVMRFLNWGWAFTNNKVPSVTQIKEQLLEMLFDVFEYGYNENAAQYQMDTAGFFVEYTIVSNEEAEKYEAYNFEDDDFKNRVIINVFFSIGDYHGGY